MLDVITDFWKPVKKAMQDNKVRADELEIGSAIGFGFVPQALLSGRRLVVSAINTYQFGADQLTSFVLSQPGEPPVSMIVAEADGEQYLALSRRISFSERMKLFDSRELDEVLEKQEVSSLRCQDGSAEFKGWVVNAYHREIRALKGRIVKGDFRKRQVNEAEGVQDFEYTLLVSDNNEHAVEIEKYGDGRLELYATIYRRITDIGQITPPSKTPGADVAAATQAEPADKATAAAPAETVRAEPVKAEPVAPAAVTGRPEPVVQKTEPAMQKPAPQAEKPVAPAPRSEPARIETFTAAPIQEVMASHASPSIAEPNGSNVKSKTVEKEIMFNPLHDTKSEPKLESAPKMEPSAARSSAPTLVLQDNIRPSTSAEKQGESEQEVLRIAERGEPMQEETLECDLNVAVKILDEAMRNEMKISDVVRRIAGLPLAGQQKVQIPLHLSESDYIILAHRYGIDASDREGIRNRVLKEVGDFSGNKQFKAA
jgi:hypothetical protein